MQPSLLWITDPWSTLSHSNDTTVRLMLEALKLGIPTYWSASNFILNSPSLTTVIATEVKNLNSKSFDQPQGQMAYDVSQFFQLHYRLDPPVDFNYISLLDSLTSRVQNGAQSQIVNPPELIKNQSEKLPPAALSHLTPLGCVLRDPESVKKASQIFSVMEKALKKIVSKPLNQAQSKGVAQWEIPKSEAEWEVLAKRVTQNYSEPILVQEFLPEINDGEVRMWFAAGEFVGALKKFPKSGDFRVLIDEGSKIEAYHLNEEEKKAASEVGAVLKKQNASLAAIDFIQGKISDYNITSPGLLVQMEKVHGGKNFAKIILNHIVSGNKW